MSDSDGIPSNRMHESAAPRLPLGGGASSASAALPVASPPPPHPLHPLAGVLGVFVCGLVAFLTLYATQPLLPLFETLFNASKSAVGWTVSASTLGVAIAAPLLGTFTERMNRKRVILISILLLAVPTCAAATSTSLGWLVFWRLLQGLITPGVFATTIAYITESWPPTAVAPVMSIYVSGTALGGFSGRAVTGVMADHAGWRASFLLLGLMSLAGAALVDTARSCESGGGASNYVSAEWHFPNLVLIKARNATLAIILQPTAFDQALWRMSFFREARATDVAYGSDQARLVKLAGLAAGKAMSDQAEANLPAVCDVTEQSRSAWKFNQELLERINTHHVAYWNAPLTHARSGR